MFGEIVETGPQKIKAFEDLRFRYEYGHETLDEICATEGYVIADFEQYVRTHQWGRVEDPDFQDEKAVDKFYKVARSKLTTLVTRRALTLWSTMVQIEDDTIKAARDAIKAINPGDTDSNPGLELSRLAKVVSTIASTSTMYTQAVAAPAMRDMNIVDLLTRAAPKTVEEAERLLKERGIPLPLEGLSLPDVGDMGDA